MKITKNFSIKEFECRDGSGMPVNIISNIIDLAEQLQILRDYVDKPIQINSGYRSPEYNKKIGGASRSMHKEGKAGDIVIKGMTPSEVYNTIEKLISQGEMTEGGLGSYKTFTHYDIGYNGQKRRW